MTNAQDRRELVDQLAQGIMRLTSSEEWRRYLASQSRFHNYSFRNVVLIAAQCPQATRVAGFRAWQRLHRCVRKGERAIWILAPLVRRRDDDEEGQARVWGFKWVPVFDIAQTEGDPVPAANRLLSGDDPAGLYGRLVGVARSLGFAVLEAPLPGGVNGDCSHAARRIRVEIRNAPAQRVKTLAHELAHAILHEERGDRRLAELEAESTAYVVCRALGLDTGQYSFGYVAVWAQGGEEAVEAIRRCGERIQQAAAVILVSLETSGDSPAGPGAESGVLAGLEAA